MLSVKCDEKRHMHHCFEQYLMGVIYVSRPIDLSLIQIPVCFSSSDL